MHGREPGGRFVPHFDREDERCTCGPVGSDLVEPAAEGDWPSFMDAFGGKLARLGPTQFWVTLTRHPDDGWPYFAHVGPDEGEALFTEVVGNFYIDDPMARLDTEQLAALQALGWGDPVDDPTDDQNVQPRNHTRSWAAPIDYPAAGALIVTTLVDVYGIRETDRLVLQVARFGICPVHDLE